MELVNYVMFVSNVLTFRLITQAYWEVSSPNLAPEAGYSVDAAANAHSESN